MPNKYKTKRVGKNDDDTPGNQVVKYHKTPATGNARRRDSDIRPEAPEAPKIHKQPEEATPTIHKLQKLQMIPEFAGRMAHYLQAKSQFQHAMLVHDPPIFHHTQAQAAIRIAEGESRERPVLVTQNRPDRPIDSKFPMLYEAKKAELRRILQVELLLLTEGLRGLQIPDELYLLTERKLGLEIQYDVLCKGILRRLQKGSTADLLMAELSDMDKPGKIISPGRFIMALVLFVDYAIDKLRRRQETVIDDQDHRQNPLVQIWGHSLWNSINCLDIFILIIERITLTAERTSGTFDNEHGIDVRWDGSRGRYKTRKPAATMSSAEAVKCLLGKAQEVADVLANMSLILHQDQFNLLCWHDAIDWRADVEVAYRNCEDLDNWFKW
ncbi:hypothetical protein BT63DRAFT_417970 [Microthyrium microscopicum]|uniref:Uncharacterized protein n=1 Tax=Microthyrium microscopicum TaxID=703497 RepID=A0A6A6TYW5_9PEZI|nr:hypothetical protein BT63DRAFT_417970 [Microthyrium microscopicum]